MPVEWGPGPQLLQIPDCIEGKKAPVVYSHPTRLDRSWQKREGSIKHFLKLT